MALLQRAFEHGLAFNERLLDRAHPKPDGLLDPARFPWTASIEARWDDLRAELDELLASQILLPAVDDLAGYPQGAEGDWTNFMLCSYGRWIDVNTARAPLMTELARQVPGVQVAGMTVLGPHTHLPRHRGPNRGALRYHLGLRVPDPPGSCRLQSGRQMHVWTDRSSIVFDDSVAHEAWNDSDESRYVLFVEFAWALPGAVGLLNRTTQAAFGLAARRIPARVTALDQVLNG